MVPRAQGAFGDDGTLSDPKIRVQLKGFLAGFAGFAAPAGQA